MIGVIVNVAAIIVGGLIGLLLKHGLSENIKRVVMQGIGLAVVIIGIAGAIATENILLLVMSLVIGGIIGALIGIEDRLDRLGQRIERRFSKQEGGFAKGFVLASLVYCVGAMAVVGSIEAGVAGDNTTLYIKSILDGVTAVIFTATVGWGVIFSSIPVLLYQGAIVLLGIRIEPYLTDELINEMSAVGSVIIMGIGINILELKHIRVGDLLPAIFIPPIWILLLSLL